MFLSRHVVSAGIEKRFVVVAGTNLHPKTTQKFKSEQDPW